MHTILPRISCVAKLGHMFPIVFIGLMKSLIDRTSGCTVIAQCVARFWVKKLGSGPPESLEGDIDLDEDIEVCDCDRGWVGEHVDVDEEGEPFSVVVTTRRVKGKVCVCVLGPVESVGLPSNRGYFVHGVGVGDLDHVELLVCSNLRLEEVRHVFD